MGGMQLRRGGGEREGNPLILRNRLAEGNALLGIFKRELNRPAANADGAGGVVNTPERHAVKRRAEAVIQLPHKLPGLDPEIFEHQLCLVPADMAEQLDDALHGEARRIRRHEEGGNATLFRRRFLTVGHSEEDAVISNRRVGGPDLPPVDDPAVAILTGAGLDHAGVRSRPRFGKAEAHGFLTAHERAENLLPRAVRHLFEQPARPEGPV